MARVWNFSAGPSTLPEQVLQTAAAEMMDYRGSGQSVMEMSHRSKTFDKIIKDAEALMRELYQVPDNYKVLFFAGRRFRPILCHSAELYERQRQGGLYHHRPVGQESLSGGPEVRRCAGRGLLCGQNL